MHKVIIYASGSKNIIYGLNDWSTQPLICFGVVDYHLALCVFSLCWVWSFGRCELLRFFGDPYEHISLAQNLLLYLSFHCTLCVSKSLYILVFFRCHIRIQSCWETNLFINFICSFLLNYLALIWDSWKSHVHLTSLIT